MERSPVWLSTGTWFNEEAGEGGSLRSVRARAKLQIWPELSPSTEAGRMFVGFCGGATFGATAASTEDESVGNVVARPQSDKLLAPYG